jgi:hypothetical protein
MKRSEMRDEEVVVNDGGSISTLDDISKDTGFCDYSISISIA